MAGIVIKADDAGYQAAGDAAYPILNARGIFRTQLELMRKDGERIWVDAGATLLERPPCPSPPASA